jgi:hypothetical protein
VGQRFALVRHCFPTRSYTRGFDSRVSSSTQNGSLRVTAQVEKAGKVQRDAGKPVQFTNTNRFWVPQAVAPDFEQVHGSHMLWNCVADIVTRVAKDACWPPTLGVSLGCTI